MPSAACGHRLRPGQPGLVSRSCFRMASPFARMTILERALGECHAQRLRPHAPVLSARKGATGAPGQDPKQTQRACHHRPLSPLTVTAVDVHDEAQLVWTMMRKIASSQPCTHAGDRILHGGAALQAALAGRWLVRSQGEQGARRSMTRCVEQCVHSDAPNARHTSASAWFRRHPSLAHASHPRDTLHGRKRQTVLQRHHQTMPYLPHTHPGPTPARKHDSGGARLAPWRLCNCLSC